MMCDICDLPCQCSGEGGLMTELKKKSLKEMEVGMREDHKTKQEKECPRCLGGLVCPYCGCYLFGKKCEWCPPCKECNGAGSVNV